LKLLFHSLAIASALALCACAGTASPTAPSAAFVPNLLGSADSFDLAFFQAFAQNAYETPGQLQPVRRLPGPLRIYLRTEDNTGRAIDAVTLETTARILLATVTIWSGERFGVAELARGTATRENMPGWLTVKWSGPNGSDRCGRSTVGVDGGFIEFNDRAECSCGLASRIYPRLVRHELGHAMGYYHTDQQSDVMYGQVIDREACDLQPSERERRHARIFYSESR